MASAYYNTDSEDEIQSPNNSVMDLNSSARDIRQPHEGNSHDPARAETHNAN